MSNKDTSTPKLIINNDLPTLYVDGLRISHRDDGMNYLSLRTNLPDYNIEQVRLIIDDQHLTSIIDLICEIIEYFPEKPTKKPRRP